MLSINGVRAPTRKIWRLVRPRSVHVSKFMQHESNKSGSPRRSAGIFGGLLSKQGRYQAFKVFEAESRIRPKIESKIGKRAERTSPARLYIQIEKRPTYLCHD